MPNDDPRLKQAIQLREMLLTADSTPSQPHNVNNDEHNYKDFRGTYSKGLLQQPLPAIGLVDTSVFDAFRKQTLRTPPLPGTPDFEAAGIKMGVAGAKLNGPLGAFAYQPVGFDSSHYGAPTVPPAPAFGSEEYGVELIELYWASLLRDEPFDNYANSNFAKQAAAELSEHPKYAGPTENGKVTPNLLFRGGLKRDGKTYFEGETVGPYVSQFLLQNANLGALPLAQKYNIFASGQDYMKDVESWYAAQNGLVPPPPDPVGQFYIYNGRGLATYTHSDELFQAYFIAHLILGGFDGIKLGNAGSPYRTYTNEKPFCSFGGPDIASTLAAVAKAAIQAVWYQKWVVHLRHRPESGGGIVHSVMTDVDSPFKGSLHENILKSEALQASFQQNGSYLLSQAFPEGAPTHPAYPTGHGTVAGACITALKFFYDCRPTTMVPNPVMTSDGGMPVKYEGQLSVDGELNKLAHNISFGHGIHAGIHWRSDTDYSILLGEAVALNYLHDQVKTYAEKCKIEITRFDGQTETIAN